MSEETKENNLTIETCIAIVILLLYTVASPIFEKKHFHYMHESGLCMIIGVIITLVAMVLSPKSNFTNTFNFNDEIFFTFILPPIIFSAGYNLRRTTFFKYFMYISAFGVLGTIISFLVVAPLTYLCDKNDLFYFSFPESRNITLNSTNNQPNITDPSSIYNETDNISEDKINEILGNETILDQTNKTEEITNKTEVHHKKQTTPNSVVINFSVAEILLFASVISATDTIAALTFIKEESEPKLFAILFGEGVLNDAVCIVLYRIFLNFTTTGQEFTAKTPMIMISSFLSIFFFSFLVGAIVGCVCAYLLKYFKANGIILNRTQEISVLLFFAFFSYTMTEEMGLSPIISLLFSGMFMSNYAFYNLSFQGREESSVVSRLMSNVAEAFVFTYLGLTLVYYMTHALSLSFIIIELFIVIFGRVVAIFGLSYIMKLCGVKSFKLKTSQKGIMSCAGSIRGAIAFGLAISIDTNNKANKEVLISSTLILVFFTTIVFGALMPLMINVMKKLDPLQTEQLVDLNQQNEPEIKCQNFSFVHPNFIDKYEGSKEKNFEVLKNRLSYWLGHYWFEFDEMYIKPRLCYQWPWARENGMNLKKIILTACHNYEEEQAKIDHSAKIPTSPSQYYPGVTGAQTRIEMGNIPLLINDKN